MGGSACCSLGQGQQCGGFILSDGSYWFLTNHVMALTNHCNIKVKILLINNNINNKSNNNVINNNNHYLVGCIHGTEFSAVPNSGKKSIFPVREAGVPRLISPLTHLCPPFQHLLSEKLTSLGIMGEPRVPPLNPEQIIVL